MTIYEEIGQERLRQAQKHGGAELDDEYKDESDWIALIAKHAGLGYVPAGRPEAIGAALDRFRKQMIYVAALAVAAAEWTDRLLTRLASANAPTNWQATDKGGDQ